MAGRRETRGQRRAVLAQAALVRVVLGEVAVVARNQSDGPLVAVDEEHVDGELVDETRAAPRARDEGGCPGRSVQDRGYVQGGRLVVPRPSLVLIAELVDEALALRARRLVVAQHVQLSLQLRALAAAHFVQSDKVTEPPTRVLAGALRLDARQLPLVSHEQQEEAATGGLEHFIQAAELLRAELQGLVHHDQVVFRQDARRLRHGPVEEEGAGAGVHVDVGVALSHAACQLSGGQGVQNLEAPGGC